MLVMLAGLFTGYVVSSFVLLRRPHLLHKPKRFPRPVKHISHRGGAGEQIENTLNAFQNAVNQGTQMLELDCHLTRDSVVIVFHDANLKRTTGVSGLVSDFDFSSLPPYLNELTVTFEPSQVYCHVQSSPARIIRLRDVFHAFPDVFVNIDIKANDDRLISEVSDLINEYNRHHLTVWGSVNSSVAAKCKRINPSVLMYPPITHGFFYLIAYHIGLLPFLSIPYDCFESPLMSVIKSKRPLHWQANDSWKIRAFINVTYYLMSSRGFYKHLKRRGIPVFMWVANTPSEFREAFELGATGIMTDYPSRLRAFLEERTD